MADHATCSFCGKAEAAVDRLFAGPRYRICNECVGLCTEIFVEHKPSGRPREGRKDTLSCSFCGKTEDEVPCLIAGPTAFICDGCADGFAKENEV